MHQSIIMVNDWWKSKNYSTFDLKRAILVIDPKRKKRKSEQEEGSSSSNSVQLSKKTKTWVVCYLQENNRLICMYSNNNGILSHGTSVAARQPKQKDKNEEWILAVVLQYHSDKNKYQVEDVDQDDFGEKQYYY